MAWSAAFVQMPRMLSWRFEPISKDLDLWMFFAQIWSRWLTVMVGWFSDKELEKKELWWCILNIECFNNNSYNILVYTTRCESRARDRLAAVRFRTFWTMFEPEPNPMFGVQVQQITEPEPEQRFVFGVSVNLNIVFWTEHFLGIHPHVQKTPDVREMVCISFNRRLKLTYGNETTSPSVVILNFTVRTISFRSPL